MSASNLCEQERQIKTQKHRGLIFGRRPHEEEEEKKKKKKKTPPSPLLSRVGFLFAKPRNAEVPLTDCLYPRPGTKTDR